MDPIVSTVEL